LPEIDESWLAPDTAAEAPLKKFAPDEMVPCNACLRANPPTRAQCMYCGASLHEAAASPEVETAAPEQIGEGKYWVVIRAPEGESIEDSAVTQLAETFHLKAEELRAALDTGAPLPLTSTPSAEDATRIISDLESKSIDSAALSTVNLNRENVPVGIRALEFAGGNITAISKIGRKRLTARLSDLQLMVTGRLLMHRVEVDEKRSRSSAKPLDRRELSQDQSVIDLYLHLSAEPWRIIVNDFDFSCLGERKGLTAFDNAKALIEVLKETTPAVLDESYARVRPILANLWPLQNTASQSRSRRPRAGRNEFSLITASDNEMQFNNYSRLVWGASREHQKLVDESGAD
jgi:hypothetical protein